MSKKDYEAVAEAFRNEMKLLRANHSNSLTIFFNHQVALLCLANRLATIYERDNENFDRARFVTACGF